MSLTPELMRLMEHEKVIEQGLGTFMDVGHALLAIRDEGEYGAAGYTTFEKYCKGRWDFSRTHAYQLMDGTETAELVSAMADIDTCLPVSERQVRPLTKFRDQPEVVQGAWRKAVELANPDGWDEHNCTYPTATQVKQALGQIIEVPEESIKPDLGNGVSHPARYSTELISTFAELLRTYSVAGARVLDPFAGTGRIHELYPEFDTVGIELEAEWAELHSRTRVGTALDLPFDPEVFDAIATSPTYGNRMADSHNASDPERRRSYTHDLGRDLSLENSGAMHWRNGTQGSASYRAFHEKAWDEAVLVLKPGGLFILNIKDHWRSDQLMPVSNWHAWCLGRLGLEYIDSLSIDTGNLRQGSNSEKRQPELVLVYGKPS